MKTLKINNKLLSIIFSLAWVLIFIFFITSFKAVWSGIDGLYLKTLYYVLLASSVTTIMIFTVFGYCKREEEPNMWWFRSLPYLYVTPAAVLSLFYFDTVMPPGMRVINLIGTVVPIELYYRFIGWPTKNFLKRKEESMKKDKKFKYDWKFWVGTFFALAIAKACNPGL